LGWGFMQTLSICGGTHEADRGARNVSRLEIIDFLIAGPHLTEKNHGLRASRCAGIAAIDTGCSASVAFERERKYKGGVIKRIRHPLPEPANLHDIPLPSTAGLIKKGKPDARNDSASIG
jgi:hypothetical protein